MNEDIRRKIRLALKGLKKTDEHKKAISKAMRGMRKSMKHKKALSESLKRHYQNKNLKTMKNEEQIRNKH